MSHHIDDIFRKGLGETSLDGLEHDWAKAAILLNLDQSGRRRFWWLWWFIGSVLILSFIGWLFFLGDHSASDTQSFASQVVQDDPVVSKLDEESTLNVNSDSNGKVNSNTNINDNSNSNVDGNVSGNSNSNGIGRVVARGTEEKEPGSSRLSNDQQKKTTNTEEANEITNDENSLPSKPSQLTIADAVKVGRSDRDHVGISDTNNKQSEVIPNEDLQGIEPVVDNAQAEQPQLTATPVDANQEMEVLIEHPEIFLTSIDVISVQPMMIPDFSITTPQVVKIEENVNAKTSPGIFLHYEPVNQVFGGGLLVHHNLNSHWSFNFGVGLTRNTESMSRTYSNVQFDARAASSELISDNLYRSVNIHIPLRIHRHFNKHSLFIGAFAERSLKIDGTQEVSVMQEFSTADIPGDPLAGPSAVEPIQAIQNYNINAVPERKRFYWHMQFGYGYDVSDHLQLSAGASYRLNRRTIISPLLKDSFQDFEKEDPWSIDLRIMVKL